MSTSFPMHSDTVASRAAAGPRGPFPPAMPATLFGRFAAAALGAECRWEVCGVFRRSFYCRSRGGSLICVGPTSLGVGPLNLLCLMPAAVTRDAGLPPLGSPATCDGTLLRIATGFSVSLTSAAVWRPPIPAPCHPHTLASNLAVLANAVRARPDRGGLQSLIPPLAAGAPATGVRGETATPLARMAIQGILPLSHWLHACLAAKADSIQSPFPEAEILIGLGPGLTPSGDDLLAGVLVALHVLGHPLLAERLAADALPRARRRTNAISCAHLATAAQGEGAAALHEVLVGLCAPGLPRLDEQLQAIDAIGHTSGWDALAGAVLAADALARLTPANGTVAGRL